MEVLFFCFGINGIFHDFVYSYYKKQKNPLVFSKTPRFWSEKGRKRGFSAHFRWRISAGCTKFFPKTRNGNFIAIYVKKWDFSPENAPIFRKNAVFSLQITQKSGQSDRENDRRRFWGLVGWTRMPLWGESANLCAKLPKMPPHGLVDSVNLCGYNGRSARFDPISAKRSRKTFHPAPQEWPGFRRRLHNFTDTAHTNTNPHQGNRKPP